MNIMNIEVRHPVPQFTLIMLHQLIYDVDLTQVFSKLLTVMAPIYRHAS